LTFCTWGGAPHADAGAQVDGHVANARLRSEGPAGGMAIGDQHDIMMHDRQQTALAAAQLGKLRGKTDPVGSPHGRLRLVWYRQSDSQGSARFPEHPLFNGDRAKKKRSPQAALLAE